MAKNNILIVGTGTIGEPLIGIFSEFKRSFGVDEIIFYKHSPRLEDRPRIQKLIDQGAVLATDETKLKEFEKIGLKPSYTMTEALKRAAVVLDCTPTGAGLENKEKFYKNCEQQARGFIAQGSEAGFGKMYVHGINDEALVPGKDKYIHVVSCNTHNLCVLIHALGLSDGRDNLIDGHFVCMRRSTDVGQADEFDPAPSVGKHKDKIFGTHHAEDAAHLFETTMGLKLNLFSSAVVLNTQYMHTLWFHLRLKRATSLEKILEKLKQNPLIALTQKMSANLIFAFGRDYGYYGRILNNTVIALPTLHLSPDGKELHGFCFTPQDGNSLISSVAAALWLLDPASYTKQLQAVTPYLFAEI